MKTLRVRDSLSGEVSSLEARLVVNAAGLQAQEVAQCLQGMPAQRIPRRHLARGCYFALKGAWLAPRHHLQRLQPLWLREQRPGGSCGLPRLML
jgi:L-2-hydroxyglutarate oxidase LhgO